MDLRDTLNHAAHPYKIAEVKGSSKHFLFYTNGASYTRVNKVEAWAPKTFMFSLPKPSEPPPLTHHDDILLEWFF